MPGPWVLVLLCSLSGFLSTGAALASEPGALSHEHNVRLTYPSRQHLLDDGIDACAKIDKDSYVTGLLFNGPGMHTYYERAYCFLELAVRERAPDLCGQVRERQSWFLDGSAVSKAVCETRVDEAIEADRQKARELAEAQGHVIESAEVIGIVEYDAVTSARSLILRARFKPLSWAYYRYEFEFVDAHGQVLARLYESPQGMNAADRLFLISFTTLEHALGGAGFESIGGVVLRVQLLNQAESALVMAHLNFEQLELLEITDSEFGRIPLLGSVDHAQWLELTNNYAKNTGGFLARLDSVLNREN